jgi:hypothetical protein
MGIWTNGTRYEVKTEAELLRLLMRLKAQAA